MSSCTCSGFDSMWFGVTTMLSFALSITVVNEELIMNREGCYCWCGQSTDERTSLCHCKKWQGFHSPGFPVQFSNLGLPHLHSLDSGFPTAVLVPPQQQLLCVFMILMKGWSLADHISQCHRAPNRIYDKWFPVDLIIASSEDLKEACHGCLLLLGLTNLINKI
jgi:hypothetical protein